MEYIIDDKTIKHLINSLFENVLVINALQISKYNNYINIKADGVYNNSPSFINLYIKFSSLIYVYIDKIYINNINIMKIKYLLLKKIKSNNLNLIDYINIEKQVIGISYNNIISILDKTPISNNFKEVMAFALLGYCTYYGIPNNLPCCTGANKRVVMGKLTY